MAGFMGSNRNGFLLSCFTPFIVFISPRQNQEHNDLQLHHVMPFCRGQRVGRSVRPSVRPSVRHTLPFSHFWVGKFLFGPALTQIITAPA